MKELMSATLDILRAQQVIYLHFLLVCEIRLFLSGEFSAINQSGPSKTKRQRHEPFVNNLPKRFITDIITPLITNSALADNIGDSEIEPYLLLDLHGKHQADHTSIVLGVPLPPYLFSHHSVFFLLRPNIKSSLFMERSNFK